MIATLLALLLAGPATAGEIAVTGIAPLILVDGVTVNLSGSSLGYVARDLSAGRHVLEARTLNGATLALSYIDVPADSRVNVTYKKKLFTITGQSPLGAAPTPAPAPSSSGAGSVAFRGLDPASYRVELAGKTLAYQPEWGAFIATELRPGSYPLSLYRMGKLVMAGDVTVNASAHAICTLVAYPLGVAGECNNAGPALPASEVGPAASVGGSVSTTTATAGGVSVQVVLNTPSPDTAPPAVPAQPAPPAPPKPMDEASLSSLVSAVEKASFSDQQVDVLRTAAAHNHFTCAQVVRLIGPIHFSTDRVNAVRVLAPQVVDPQNAYVIEDALTFSSEKEEVRKLFR